MKKLIITIIIAISFILILKNIITTKYSHNDIVNLINKGMKSMNNISFNRENKNGTNMYYYKENKKKIVSEDNNNVTIEENGKTYIINKEKKTMAIYPSIILNNGLQYEALHIERLNEKLNKENNFRYEYIYIRDEKIENKDCIFVKEAKYYSDTKEYIDNVDNSEKAIPVYWIEKATGLVIGAGFMELEKNTASPQVIIKDIKYGEVSDDIFNDIANLPSDYVVLENNKVVNYN